MRDMPTWIKSVEDRLREHDRRIRSGGHLMAFGAETSRVIGSGGFTTLNLGAEVINPQGFYTPASGVYLIPQTGVWELTGSLRYEPRPAAASHLMMTANRNGSEITRWSAPGNVAGSAVGCSGAAPFILNKGDTIVFYAYQDSGGNTQVTYARHMLRLIRPI